MKKIGVCYVSLTSSKEAHDGKLTVADWRVTVVSSHRGALSRQVKEAVSISNEGVDNLLNSKMEFGVNNLTEITVKQGFNVVGALKRRRRLSCSITNDVAKLKLKEAIASLYLGETSRSARERVSEHLWMFTHKKQACGELCTKVHKHSSTNSALWVHSKEAHDGKLTVAD